METHSGNSKLPIIVLAIWFACMLWLFFPGYMSTDSYNQLAQARGLSPYADAHPIILARLWGILDIVYPGPLLMLVLQLVLVAWGLKKLTEQFLKSSVQVALALALLLFAPPVFSIVGIIWKDVWTLIALVWGLEAAIRAFPVTGSEEKPSKRTRLFALVQALIWFVLAALFRANAIGAGLAAITMVAISFLWWGQGKWHQKTPKAAAIFGVFVVLFLGASWFVQLGITVTKRNFDTITMGFDLSGMSVAAGKRLFDTGYKEFIDDNATLEDIEIRFSPRYHACLYRECSGRPALLTWTQNPEDLSHIRKNWLEAIRTHPLAWVVHRSKVAEEILNINGAIWAPILREPFVGSAVKLDDSVWDTRGRIAMRKLIEANSLTTHRAVVYLLLAAGLIPILLVSIFRSPKNPEKRYGLLAILLTGLAYEATILLAATSPDYRYSQPMIALTLFVAVVLLIQTSVSIHLSYQRKIGKAAHPK